MWLLLAVVLNLQTNPPQIQHGEIVGTYSTEKACLKAQADLLEEYKPIPPPLNLGCLPLNNVKST
jgi:hypothetical protein